MDSDRLIHKLKSDGFVNAGQLALSAKESAELRRLADEICNNLAPDHPLYLSPQCGCAGVDCLPQLHPEIAKLIDKVVSNAEVRLILESVLAVYIYDIICLGLSSFNGELQTNVSSFSETDIE